ncbi:gamma-glutamylcyclotransferase-like [Salvelinus alpinus]|uniref:gamma-glutamylcyclotransferase-like n=1 Tax=Salvelinus alpinus TaxID=8036 RepID=UPI0039FC1461
MKSGSAVARRPVTSTAERRLNKENEWGVFLYFAYGSNLLKERLQLKNPSASIHCVARLKDYKLIFGNYKGLASDRWHGGVATIENSPADEVWGVVWRMNVADLESLDSQENVRLWAYSPVEVNMKTRDQELNCRTYIMNSCIYAPPSPQYLKETQLLLHAPPSLSFSLSHTVLLSQSSYIYFIPNTFKNMDLTLNPVRS